MPAPFVVAVGSGYDVKRTVPLEAGLGLLEKAWFTVKANATQTDDEAIVKKSITTAATSSGQITNAGASGSGEFVFYLVNADTTKFVGGKRYQFDIWIKTTGRPDPRRADKGIIIAEASITRSFT